MRDLTYDRTTDAYYFASVTEEVHGNGALVIERSGDSKHWSEVYHAADADTALPVEWGDALLNAAKGIVAVVGDATRLGPGNARTDMFWSLTSADGRHWQWSAGWPDMLTSVNLRTLSIARGAIVAVSFDGANALVTTGDP